MLERAAKFAGLHAGHHLEAGVGFALTMCIQSKRPIGCMEVYVSCVCPIVAPCRESTHKFGITSRMHGIYGFQ